MQRESDSDSESECGIPLVPVAVSKSRGVDYQLRKEISFLSNLRKEYEVNMLEVKKELLDEKINKKKVEEQRKEFLEAVIKGRHQWQQEKESLEKEMTDLREKVAELTGKLKLQELNRRARSPSVMPKEERVAAVDSMMEVVGVRNEIAATARLLKRLIEENGELKNKNNELVEENTDMKNEMEKLHSQVLSKVLGNEEGRGEVKEELSAKVNQVTSMKENRRRERGVSGGKKGEGRDTTPKKRARGDRRADVTPKKQKERREYGEKIAALEKARSEVGQARDPGEISWILGRLNAEKVAKDFPSGMRTASDQVGIC